jgi:hypothetical protein
MTSPHEIEYGHSWKSLVEVARRGLAETYRDPDAPLPHTRCWDVSARLAVAEGDNPRYALITLLGLGRSRLGASDHADLIKTLWSRIAKARDRWRPTPGDLGLALWARALHDTPAATIFSTAAAHGALREGSPRCDSVELAWLLLGADHAAEGGLETSMAAELADEAKLALLQLFNSSTALFYRRPPRGILHAVPRRVPCFANQIYPLMALSVHARRTGCARCRETARAVADRLCALQGPLGQWWWLYDAEEGTVVDGYPVYSVHQDGMAPMALIEAGRAVGRSYELEIERGLRWVFGDNERRESLVLAEHGLVLRDIHGQGVGRARRALRAALWCRGRRGHLRRGPGPFVVNAECRPYHLGWILYAAALREGAGAGH